MDREAGFAEVKNHTCQAPSPIALKTTSRIFCPSILTISIAMVPILQHAFAVECHAGHPWQLGGDHISAMARGAIAVGKSPLIARLCLVYL